MTLIYLLFAKKISDLAFSQTRLLSILRVNHHLTLPLFLSWKSLLFQYNYSIHVLMHCENQLRVSRHHAVECYSYNKTVFPDRCHSIAQQLLPLPCPFLPQNKIFWGE